MAQPELADRRYPGAHPRCRCVQAHAISIDMIVWLTPDRYNPNNLSWMEEYLGTQVASEDYDLLANLAILKLSADPTGLRDELTRRYQFNPQMSNPDSIINILLKSLSATIHGPDFNLCLSLLREPTVRAEILGRFGHELMAGDPAGH